MIHKASLVVTNDSGPMHISAAMQKPTLALFGPTEAEKYGPYPLNALSNHVIQAENKKMDGIELNTVLGKVLSLI